VEEALSRLDEAVCRKHPVLIATFNVNGINGRLSSLVNG
jgi:hypothetical protein